MSKKFSRSQLRKLIQQEVISLGEDILVHKNSKRQGTPPLAPQMSRCTECGASMYEGDRSCMECGSMYEQDLSEGDCGCSSAPSASLGDFQDLSSTNITHDDAFLAGNAVSDASHKSGAYMSKSQLHKVTKYSAKLYEMIPDNHDLQDWMRTKISQIADDIGEVYHALEHDIYDGDI